MGRLVETFGEGARQTGFSAPRDAADRLQTRRDHPRAFLAVVLERALDDRIAAPGRVGSWSEIVTDRESRDQNKTASA
jgi:hypothetical protein